jgi:hypothetical protein
MANKKKNNGISIANFIAIIGLVILMIFSFMGRSYLSGGEMIWSIIISIGITIVSAILLWLLIKAKSAENEIAKWKVVEITTLVIYLIFACATVFYSGITHFFVVNGNKDTIKTYAETDFNKIDSLFINYEDFEELAITTTSLGLENAIDEDAILDEDLETFFEENNTTQSTYGIENFVELQRDKLLGETYESLKKEYEKKRKEIMQDVKSWNTLFIPYKAHGIEKLATEVSTKLNQMSEDALLPIIEMNEDGFYTLAQEDQSNTFDIEGGVETLKFRKAIIESGGISLTAIFITLLIHLLILFNYVVAYRTHTVGIKKGKKGGIPGGILID